MNYDIAKQLKDAGFPQEGEGTYSETHDSMMSSGCNVYRPNVYYPTLSELIAAMPQRMKSIGSINDAHFVFRKLVTQTKDIYSAYYEDEDTNNAIDGYAFFGGMSEVVARLWIAVNKKLSTGV